MVKGHFIRKYATDMRVDGVKRIVYCYSCTPCAVHGASYRTKHARDKAVLLHAGGGKE